MRKIRSGFFLAACVLLRPLSAQDAANFRVLSIPPATAGTCSAVDRSGPKASRITGTQLVMRSRVPGQSRDISLTNGSVRGDFMYMELTHSSTSRFTSEGDAITATIDRSGAVRGTRAHMTTVMTDSAAAKSREPSKRLAVPRHTKTSSVRDPLDSADQRKVLELVQWLKKRCPSP
jgi:hypothetical protein